MEKVTVSIPGPTFAAVERTRRRLRKTRSAVVSEALAEWLRARDVPEEDRLYVEAYLRQPERESAVADAAAAAAAEWERWEE